MELSWRKIEWELRHSFNLSIHSRVSTPAVLITIKYQGKEGIGEISLPPYMKENQASVIKVLKGLDISNLSFKDAKSFHHCLDKIGQQVGENLPCMAGLDIALHQLYTQLIGESVNDFYGLKRNTKKATSFTITYDKDVILREKLDLAKPFKILKIKLGTKYDKSFISTIRKYTDKPLYVDVNQGWQSLDKAIEMIDFLEKQNVQVIEQPFDKANLELHRQLKPLSSIPIIADESLQSIVDLDKMKDAFHGVNIKLMKAGGIRNAFRMIEKAKTLNLETMLGCMTSSTCAISAANHLSEMVDYIDLDGAFLITNDPFYSLKMKHGVLYSA